MRYTFTASLVDNAHWNGTVDISTAIFSCWAMVLATNLRTMSPAMLPQAGTFASVQKLNQNLALGARGAGGRLSNSAMLPCSQEPEEVLPTLDVLRTIPTNASARCSHCLGAVCHGDDLRCTFQTIFF